MARAGEMVRFSREWPPERQSIATYETDWNWTMAVAGPYRLEGSSVPRFLDWATRELGVRREFADPAVRRRIDPVVLHGSVDGLTHDDALAAVLPTCGLTHVRQGARLVVIARD